MASQICDNCLENEKAPGDQYCTSCIERLDTQADEELNRRFEEPEEAYSDEEPSDSYYEAEEPKPNLGESGQGPKPTGGRGLDGVAGGESKSLKEQAIAGAVNSVAGKNQAVQKAQEVRQQAERVAASMRATGERLAWSAKIFVAAVTNPAFWVSLLVLVVIYVVANISVSTYQTVGPMENAQTASQGAVPEMLGRLAQRAVLLQTDAHQTPRSEGFMANHNGPMGRTNNNPWLTACPDVVNIIYGMPKLYIGNNGNMNAIRNYERLIAGGLKADAWWFPGNASSGATRDQPPAGAIVSATGSRSYGHTFVTLSDDGKVIDNPRLVTAKGPTTGYRTLTDANRAAIVGWFLPPSEGYEGTFLNDDPKLPPVPEWMGAIEGSGGPGGQATVPSGDAQTMAAAMVKERGWDDAQFTCLVKLWTRESGWNVSAHNPSSGAYGIPQSLPGNKMASVGPDWRTNPATQITWGLNYIQGRYGAPCGAWDHSELKNWY